MTNDSVHSAPDADAAAANASSMSVLLEVTRAVRSGADIADLLGPIARAASEALGFGTVVLNLYRPEWDDLCVAAVHGDPAVREALAGAVYGWDGWLPLLHPEDELFVPLDDANEQEQVNDEFGHAAGDRVLEQVGACLRSLEQDGGPAFRVGGDEFAVLLPSGDGRQADELVGHLIASVGRHLDPLVRKPSASFGVAAGRCTEEPDELLRRADEAMDAAQRAARMEVAV